MFNIMTMLQCFATFCDIFLSINEFGNGVHTLLIYWFCEAKCSHPDKLASPFTRTWHHHCIFTERFCIQRIARNVRSKCSWRSGQNVRIEAVVASDASVALDKKTRFGFRVWTSKSQKVLYWTSSLNEASAGGCETDWLGERRIGRRRSWL